jgi:hypothetical protein
VPAKSLTRDIYIDSHDVCKSGFKSSTLRANTVIAVRAEYSQLKVRLSRLLTFLQVSSMCGSADVLEALGVEIELGPESVAACVEATNMGFMFAPRYHPVMRHVAPVRKALGVRTAFNILGPMLNPAAADYALVRVRRRVSVSLARSLPLSLFLSSVAS